VAFENSSSFPNLYQTYEELDMKEVSDAVKVTFISRKGPVVLACGDDRGPTPESLGALAEQGLPIENAYMRCFGGIYGAARALLVGAVAQHGPEVIDELGDNFLEAAVNVARQAAEQNVIMISHSAEGAEGSPLHLDEHSKSGLACAYAAGVGAVCNLSAFNELVIRNAEFEAASLFGSPQDANTQRVVDANRLLADEVFGRDEPMSIKREDVISFHIPAMILEGSHAPSDKVKHVYNFEADKISDPNEANARKIPYYATDVTQLVEVLKKGFPQFDLDSDLLVNAIVLDVSATKAALAMLDGQADPSRIESQRLGNPTEALAHLSAV